MQVFFVALHLVLKKGPTHNCLIDLARIGATVCMNEPGPAKGPNPKMFDGTARRVTHV